MLAISISCNIILLILCISLGFYNFKLRGDRDAKLDPLIVEQILRSKGYGYIFDDISKKT